MAITGINNSSYTSYYASNYKNTVKKTDSEKDSTNTKDGNVTTSTVELKTSRPGVTKTEQIKTCLLYTSPSPRDGLLSRMPSSA